MQLIPGISIPSISTYNVRSEVQNNGIFVLAFALFFLFYLIYVYFGYLSMRGIPVQPSPDC
ncbi:hypothetical protein BDZ91DRAFT_740725 [Kalaharituber pfeilii]|nr:hypothetical protein BDZ91DRAFT_754154 [Kalaharituber pfeilii]KAF8459963.1 hypothetical protein BDZ91DRAFT_740725 [Kalaharituber pfeilii]